MLFFANLNCIKRLSWGMGDIEYHGEAHSILNFLSSYGEDMFRMFNCWKIKPCDGFHTSILKSWARRNNMCISKTGCETEV